MKEATVTRGVGRFILLHVTNFLVDYGAESSAKMLEKSLTVRVPVDSVAIQRQFVIRIIVESPLN